MADSKVNVTATSKIVLYLAGLSKMIIESALTVRSGGNLTRNSQHVRNKKNRENTCQERKKKKKKNNHTHKTIFTWFGNLPTSTELQRFHYYKKKIQSAATVFQFLKNDNNNRTNPNHQKWFFTSYT